MTVTTPTHVDTSIPELYAKRVMRNTLRAGFWGRFAGGVGSGMPIIQQTELLNKPGDLIHIQITDSLTGSGVSGDTTALEGSEENLSTSEMKVSPTLYRHGVRIYRRANKKSMIDLREEARFRLEEWGTEKVDDKRFSQFVSVTNSDIPENTGYDQPNAFAPNSSDGFATDGSITIDDVAADDKLTVAAIQKLRYHALSLNMRPFKVGGLPFFALVISPEVEYHLKQDTTYQSYVINAANRGMDNPVFTGAIANIEGVVLYSHFNSPCAANATSVRVNKGLMFGAESFVEGWDEDVRWVEDTFDYENEWGVGYSFAFQPRRGLEKNTILVYTDATLP